MRVLALAIGLAVGSCAQDRKPTAQIDQATQELRSPYASYLPQAPPSEANRVEFPPGYSIVSPVGWVTRTIQIEDWSKDSISDQIVIEGTQRDQYRPRITIQHLGPGQNALYMGWLKSDRILPDGWVRVEFQNQPALTKFLPGYGARRSTREGYEPWLSEYLFCERDGHGFILKFDMRNADRDKPYFMQPLPIIQEYFDTFRFSSPKK